MDCLTWVAQVHLVFIDPVATSYFISTFSLSRVPIRIRVFYPSCLSWQSHIAPEAVSAFEAHRVTGADLADLDDDALLAQMGIEQPLARKVPNLLCASYFSCYFPCDFICVWANRE
jgi:hypothetical protein